MSIDWGNKLTKIVKMTYDPMTFFYDSFFLGWKLRPAQRKILTDFYSGNYNIMIGCAGMRGGKTTTMAGGCLYDLAKLLVMKDPFKHYNLLRAQPICIIGVSYKEETAVDTIFSIWETTMKESPFFREIGPRVLSDSVHFDNQNMLMRVGGANSPGLVGHTNIAVLLDEIDKFRDTRGRTSGWLLYDQITAGTKSFGMDGHSYCCSSPTARKGIIMQLLDQAKASTNMYWFHMPTWEMNPDITRKSLQAEYDRDPISAERDYGANPGPEDRPYFANRSILKLNPVRPNVLQQLDQGLTVIPGSYRYVLAADPSKKFDSMGLGLGHKEQGRFVIDGLKRFIPESGVEIDSKDVRRDVMNIVNIFPVEMYVADTWHYAELQDDLARMGIIVENHIVRIAEYEELKTSLYEGYVDICNYPYVLKEMEELELIQERKVDHPRHGSKDVADCVANLIWGMNNLPERVGTPFNVIMGFSR